MDGIYTHLGGTRKQQQIPGLTHHAPNGGRFFLSRGPTQTRHSGMRRKGMPKQ